MKKLVMICAVIGMFWAVSSAIAYTVNYSTDFDSMAIGKIGGQNNWVDSESTYTETITTDAAHSGNQSWWLGMNTTNTMVESIQSPKVPFAGESLSSRNISTTNKAFSYEFWFKTKADHANHENLYINSSLAQEASIRQSWFCIMDGDKWGSANENNTSGQIGMGPFADDELRIVAYGQGAVSAAGAYSQALVWGDWYKIRVDALFKDGFDAANDLVTYTLWDASMNQIWTSTMTSWERPYYSGVYEPQQAGYNAAVNMVSFDWSTFNTPAGIYIDDFKIMTAVPEPMTIALLSLGGLLLRRKK
jgi:hypothetical protein